jgi:uncharacterized protein YbjT (DUF2867 family)
MVRTLVTGATGTLGTALRPRLTEASHTVRAASRSPPAETTTDIEWVALDLAEDTEIESAVEDVDIIIHTATAPQGDTEAVDVTGTERLLEAAMEVGVKNFVYPSIVGIDDIPYSYYEHKRTAEDAVETSDLPTTTVPATQFHSFVADLLDTLAKLPIWLLPTRMQVQPVDVREVADRLVEYATVTAAGRTNPIGGPEVYTVGDLARAYRRARELRRPILRVPFPGETTAAFRAGHATCPEYAAGSVTWKEWLAEQYTGDTDDRRQHKQPAI